MTIVAEEGTMPLIPKR